MKEVFFVAIKDFFYTLKEKTVLLWMFIMPLVFFGFIGSTTGGFAGNSGQVKNIAIWESVADQTENDLLAQQIVYRLKQENFNTVIFNQNNSEKFKNYTRNLWLPDNLSEMQKKGQPTTIEYSSKASGLDQDQDKFGIEKAIYQTLGDILLLKKLETSEYQKVNEQPRNLELQVESAGEKQEIPSGFNQAVPGILVMFVMMIALTSGATALFLERQSGVLKRLAATPISTQQIILGKWLGKWFLAILQLIYGMLIGWLVFKIHWGEHSFAIFLFLSLWAAFNASLSILLGSLATSEAQVSAVATLASLLFAALGGCWWPIEITPQWMQSFASFLPTGWVMEVMHKLMYFGANISDVNWQIFTLSFFSIVALYLAYKKFKFS